MMNEESVSAHAPGRDLGGLGMEGIAEVLLGAGVGVGPLAPNHARLALTIYRELAEGRPLPPATLDRAASAAGISAELAKEAGARWLEFDAAGSVIGFGGLTLLPTPHRLVLDDATLYLWCALDGFLIAHALRRSVRVETLCPASGAAIDVRADTGGVTGATPSSAVMSIVAPPLSCPCSVSTTRRGFCDFVSFYRSEQEAGDATKARGGAILSLDAAFSMSALLMGPLRDASV